MTIVCPNCTTSYAVDPTAFGAAGRIVRCARCKQTWLARPEEAVRAETRVPEMTAVDNPNDSLENDAGWGDLGDDDDTPVVDSPSITSEMPDDGETQSFAAEADWPSRAQNDVAEEEWDAPARKPSWLGRLRQAVPLPPMPKIPLPKIPLPTIPIPKVLKPFVTLSSACAAMAALTMALVFWRADVVRLLPQTATLYQIVGLEVNLRGLAIKDVKISTETVDSKPVLVIEGIIVDIARKPIDVPRLRFVVRDERGTEIYAWNAVLEKSQLKPGESAWFRSRLASPPAEARNVEVRFFNRRDLAGGGA
jgi:predicted Zn finger-like uncharacterized protein